MNSQPTWSQIIETIDTKSADTKRADAESPNYDMTDPEIAALLELLKEVKEEHDALKQRQADIENENKLKKEKEEKERVKKEIRDQIERIMEMNRDLRKKNEKPDMISDELKKKTPSTELSSSEKKTPSTELSSSKKKSSQKNSKMAKDILSKLKGTSNSSLPINKLPWEVTAMMNYNASNFIRKYGDTAEALVSALANEQLNFVAFEGYLNTQVALAALDKGCNEKDVVNMVSRFTPAYWNHTEELMDKLQIPLRYYLTEACKNMFNSLFNYPKGNDVWNSIIENKIILMHASKEKWGEQMTMKEIKKAFPW